MPTESCCIKKPRTSRGRWSLTVAAWSALATLGSSGASADDANTLLTAARSSMPLVDLRLRFENVEQDGIFEEADALTLRARLGFETGKVWNTSLLAEAELLSPLQDDYNSTTNGHTASPIVNDPESYEINRLQLANRSIPDTRWSAASAARRVKGFATPRATLHKFPGWADKFGVTPPNGLEHRYATLGFSRKSVGVFDTLGATLVYHRFDSSRLNVDYGSEIDLQLQARWRYMTCLIKYADYHADAFATDTRKYWLQVEYAL